jgi:hypothetical protein
MKVPAADAFEGREKIWVKKGPLTRHSADGTEVLAAVARIKDKAALNGKHSFTVDAQSNPDFVIVTTCATVAAVLREELPKSGFALGEID